MENTGVVFVPAFGGLLCPYWKSNVSGSLFGITQATDKRHIVRSVMESIAFRNYDVLKALEKDYGEIG